METAPFPWCGVTRLSHAVWSSSQKKKKDLSDTGIFVLCYNCEIVYNHETYLLLHLLLVQHLTVSVLISQLKKKDNHLLNIKIYLIESVEVPLEFNIIF